MNTPDPAAEREDLPDFLSEPEVNTLVNDDRPEAEAEAEDAPVAEDEEVYEKGSDAVDEEVADEGFVGADEIDYDDECENEGSVGEPGYTSRRRRRGRGNQPATAAGGGLATGIAVVSWLGAVGLALAGDQLPQLQNFGCTPGTLFVLGAVAMASATVRRHLARVQASQDMNQSPELDDELREQLAYLVENSANNSDSPVDSNNEDAQHVRLALQRQDEKINNLTRAIKMYGKPLVNIANQGTEVSASLTQLRTNLEAGHDSIRNNLLEVANQVRQSVEQAPSFEPLQQQLGKLEVAVQAMTQRLEDSETRKTLMRLEDSTKTTQDEVRQLLRGESIDTAANKLQQQLEDATAKLHQGLGQLRDGNLGDLETQVRDIQREVSSVATSVSQIQATIKNTARTSAAVPTPQAATAPAAAAASPAGKMGPATPAADDSGKDSAGYQTGARKSGGKNVLGAIAKLKQMKG